MDKDRRCVIAASTGAFFASRYFSLASGSAGGALPGTTGIGSTAFPVLALYLYLVVGFAAPTSFTVRATALAYDATPDSAFATFAGGASIGPGTASVSAFAPGNASGASYSATRKY